MERRLGLESCVSYNLRVHRLLQFGTIMLLLAAFVIPLLELCDRWDAPGLGNDTEMGVFFLVLVLCLVLVVCKLIAASSGRLSWITTLLPRWEQTFRLLDQPFSKIIFIPPQFPPPLRI